MRVAMIGSGYVGLVSGACFADFGHHVTCVDKDESKIAALERGETPIYEPGLTELIATNVKQGRLSFATDLKTAVSSAQAVFISVGTRSRRGDGHADLSYVYAAAREIAQAMSHFTVVVTKSTVPVGTGDEVERVIRSERPDAEFAVVSNPEFLREGAAIRDFKHPDRRTAELIKYAANSFLATKITFINEIADLAEKVGADVQEIARGIGLDNRIGSKFLHPGPGFGGSCFPKDTRALARLARNHDTPVRLVEAVIEVNEAQRARMVAKILRALELDESASLEGTTLGVLGLAFKPDTDDVRESPALAIVAELRRRGARVQAYDPAAMEAARSALPDVVYRPDAYSVAEDADAVVLMTEWNQFRNLDLSRMKSLMRRPILVDLRNVYEPERVRAIGLTYQGVGRS